MKKENAVTLIALVITIIILVILATISINFILGENGVFKQAEIASIESRAGVVDERSKLWKTEVFTSTYLDTTPQSRTNILDSLLNEKLLTQDEYTILLNDKNAEITIGSKTIDFKVENQEDTISDFVKQGKIKIGDYIKYPIGMGKDTVDGKFTVKKEDTGYSLDTIHDVTEYTGPWRVLYLNEKTGVISIYSPENILVNSGVFLAMKKGYINSVPVLNNVTRHFINEKYASSARAFGSDPDNPDGTTEVYDNPDYPRVQKYAPDMLKDDMSYVSDVTALRNAKMFVVSCWYASRAVTFNEEYNTLQFGINTPWGDPFNLANISETGMNSFNQRRDAVLAVITLKPNVAIDTSNPANDGSSQAKAWAFK